MRLAIDEQVQQLLNSVEEQETTIILFDTEKSPAENTGLPPVKAAVRQTARREETQQENRQSQVQSETQLNEDTTDKSVEETTATMVTEQKAGWWEMLKQHIVYILLIPVLAIVLWVMYKLIKNLK